jgi:hypothetical protein
MTGSELVERVRLYCDIAKVNGSLLSLSELLAVLPEHRSEEELQWAIKSNPELDARYELRSGFIFERSNSGSFLESTEQQSRVRAKSNLKHALSVFPLLHSSEVLLLGIGGSTSYNSASKSKDIDFFCVTRKGTLWLFLARALILSRAYRYLRSDVPDVCLSCTLDSGFAEETFGSPRDSLFARDALSMIVVSGMGFYHRLLRKGSWISEVYPRLYATRQGNVEIIDHPRQEPTVAHKVANWFLYYIVGTYIRAKSRLLNARLARQGRYDSIFTLLIGEDRCIYESVRYSKMRRMYESLGAK